MATTLLKTNGSPERRAAREALRKAGIGVVEVNDWIDAADELRRCEAALVVCSGEIVDPVAAGRIGKAIRALTDTVQPGAPGLSPETARALSHDLRTPLSAMAGWLHLIESGNLDEEGMRRAIARLRGNIDDQVRTIERILGTHDGGASLT
jgi:signal transduction histidine kinase